MTLKPIGAETQIEDCIFGKSMQDNTSINMKIDFAKKNVNSIISINGKKVYHPIIKDDNVFYFLKKAPHFLPITDETKRKYYYPIQYAEIVFFDKKP